MPRKSYLSIPLIAGGDYRPIHARNLNASCLQTCAAGSLLPVKHNQLSGPQPDLGMPGSAAANVVLYWNMGIFRSRFTPTGYSAAGRQRRKFCCGGHCQPHERRGATHNKTRPTTM